MVSASPRVSLQGQVVYSLCLWERVRGRGIIEPLTSLTPALSQGERET
jgi:hypothetical protein